MKHLGLGPGPEFDAIRAIVARLGHDATGIGTHLCRFLLV